MGGVEDERREHDSGRSTPELSATEERSPVDAGDDYSRKSSVIGFRGLVWGVSIFLLFLWCLVALSIGVKFAETVWDWLPIVAFGGGVPAVILWQANRVLARLEQRPVVATRKEKEKELLEAFSGRGELTAITAAMHTSLTADEASRMLEALAKGGHLLLRVDDGVQTYALREPDRREVSQTPPGAAAVPASEGGESPQPLEEDLSEREMEVLALLASGRTNSEIAGDLFVAPGTVKAHVANIYRKLGAKNRAEALLRARELNLLP